MTGVVDAIPIGGGPTERAESVAIHPGWAKALPVQSRSPSPNVIANKRVTPNLQCPMARPSSPAVNRRLLLKFPRAGRNIPALRR